MSGASNAKVSVSVARPVFRFRPARLTHAPVNRCVTGSKDYLEKSNDHSKHAGPMRHNVARGSGWFVSSSDMLSKWLIKWNNSRILPMNSVQKSNTRLLLCSRDGDSLLAMQREVFRASGYEVVATASKEQIQEHIENTDFDVVVLNHTLSFSDRKAIARKTKQLNPNNGVLVLHHSGSLGNPYVDLAVDSRGGVKPVLD